MEDAAILSGFENLKDGSEYDSLYASALCRSKADWLVGINATRLFSVMYHRTLNVRVSPRWRCLYSARRNSAFQPGVLHRPAGFGDFRRRRATKDKSEAQKLAGKLQGTERGGKVCHGDGKDGESPALTT